MDALICGKRGLTLDELEGVLEKTATVLATAPDRPFAPELLIRLDGIYLVRITHEGEAWVEAVERLQWAGGGSGEYSSSAQAYQRESSMREAVGLYTACCKASTTGELPYAFKKDLDADTIAAVAERLFRRKKEREALERAKAKGRKKALEQRELNKRREANRARRGE